mmetsp:Transcript_8416/g.21735  ORF Transcript_8416/g.21735 Transcript_8416/m.21735 type:complete len:215 (-) Transcript_8416:87-731(-)
MPCAQTPVCTSASPLPADEVASLEAAEPARAALESALRAHVSDVYPTGVLSVFGTVEDGGGVTIVACYAAREANLPNFHAGALRARWQLVLPPNAGRARAEAQLSGELSARVHYFEDGNVRLDTSERWAMALPISEGEGAVNALALAAAARVKQAEGEWHSALLDRFVMLSDSGVKALRRPLPMTKTKFEFDKAAQHLLSDQLTKVNLNLRRSP